jgi:hypothetical protein
MKTVGGSCFRSSFGFSRKRTVIALLLLLPTAGVLHAQSAGKAPATVSFTLDFPNSIPDHYTITVASDGHATYDSTGKLTPEGEAPEPFHYDFQLSLLTETKIFDLAGKAKYFEGKIDSGKKNLAFTGQKTLVYKDATRTTKAEYNYSPNVPVQELTALFQNLSTTLEFGRRLDYYHHYQKLALDDELKRMEEQNREGSLVEVQAVAPILRVIANDNSVVNVARARAQRLMMTKVEAGTH